MDITQEVILVLQGADYRIKESFDGMSSLYFEDSTIIGFVSIHQTCDDIISKWKDQQTEFLRRNASRLRLAPIKAWNAYSIFLTADSSVLENTRQLNAIEEDFQGTRKIARGDILTGEDVERALYPILPVRNIAPLQPGDPLARLWLKLQVGADIQAALLGSHSAEDLADILTSEAKQQ